MDYDPLRSDGPPPRSALSPAQSPLAPPTPAKDTFPDSPSLRWPADSPLRSANSLSSLPPRPPLGQPNGTGWPASPHGSLAASTSSISPRHMPVSPPAQAPFTSYTSSTGPAVRPVSPGEPRSPYTTATPPSAFAASRYPALQRVPSPENGAPARKQVEKLPVKPVASPDDFLRVRVHGFDRTKKEVWVKMDAATNLSSYHSGQIKPFSRSFAEFLSLHAALAGNHPEAILPALPLVQTSAATDEEEDRLVRIAFQKWIDRVTRHGDLMRDEELRIFLEANFGYSPTTNRRRGKASATFSKLRRAVPEEDDELGLAKGELTKLEVAFNDVARASDKECTARRGMAIALHAVHEQVASFSTTETHRPLAIGLRKFADGVRRTSELENGQATAEGVTLVDGLAYEAAEAKEGRETLTQRQAIVDEYRSAVKSTITKQRQVEKLKGGSTIKRDRADDALDELDEAQKAEQTLSSRVQAISTKLAPSVRSHTQQMHRDLLQILSEHANAGLSYERQVLRDLEALQPDLRNIPPKGQGEVTYKHAPESSASSVPGSPSSSRNPLSPTPSNGVPAWGSPTPTAPLGRSPSMQSSRTQGFGAGTQSMIVPPTHAGTVSRSTGGRVADLARSVHVSGSADLLKGRPGEKVADERQRVDARMAASKLANLF